MAKKKTWRGELLFGRMLRMPPVRWRKFVDGLLDAERVSLVQYGMGLALRAAEVAAYVDVRQPYNSLTIDNHQEAVKNVNRVGRIVHCGAFGFNEYLPFSF